MAQRKEHFHGKSVLGMSIVQIIFGVACIILQIVLIVTYRFLGDIGQGIWAGIFVSITYFSNSLVILLAHPILACTAYTTEV